MYSKKMERKKGDRTGTGTIKYLGYQMRFNLKRVDSLYLQRKKVSLKAIIHELLHGF